MKYIGSKERISNLIVPFIQDCIDDNNIKSYIEPFVGSCAIIEKINCKLKQGFDSNQYLIALWREVQRGLDLSRIYLTKEQYDKVKNNKDEFPDWMVGFAGFLCTYNAKFFGGYAKVTTTKIGTTRNYQDESIRNIMKQSNNITDIKFKNIDFFDIKYLDNNFIYLDPPYDKTTSYELKHCGKEEFNFSKYLDKTIELSKNNFVICSEYQMPENFICIWEKNLTTTLDNASRKIVTEKLFTLKDGLYHKWMQKKGY